MADSPFLKTVTVVDEEAVRAAVLAGFRAISNTLVAGGMTASDAWQYIERTARERLGV